MADGSDTKPATRTILLAGNPNSGKTTLFNALTGAGAKVGNYPGITVDRRSAPLALEGGAATLVDLPGCYSMTARSAEERVAIDAVLATGADAPSMVVVVLDATTLRRGLYFASQVLEAGVPCVLALSMMDEAEKKGLALDRAILEREVGCPVVRIVATRREGLDDLRAAIQRGMKLSTGADRLRFAAPVEAAIASVEAVVTGEAHARRCRALWALLSLGDDELPDVPQALRDAVAAARVEAEAQGVSLDEALVTGRYRWVDATLDGALVVSARPKRRSLDDVLVHPLWGLLVFAVVMFVVFQALFAWAEPLTALIEAGVGWAKTAAKGSLPPGPFTDLVSDGVIAGVGNVVVFVPQIALLFVFLTVLEDSGYLARVAFVIDRLMAKVGLNGRAFVPMLSGFACAIPAVMATRTIDSRRDRLLTMMVVPLSSCSARLPVYVLVTSVVFDPERKIFGLLSLGALVLFGLYTLSTVAALGAAYVFGKTALKGSRSTLVLELPPYRWPRLGNIAIATGQRVRRFLLDAGTVILALTIVLWALLNYPRDGAREAALEAQRVEATAIVDEAERDAALAEIDHTLGGERLRNSAGGRLGRAIEPALRPLGFDWKVGIGIIGAFAAREVFVSTLGIVYDVGEADEASEGLHAQLRAAKHADGASVFTPLSGVALMVFFVLACQCMSTLAVVRRESGSWKWPGIMFGYMTVLAYVVTLGVYQVGRLLGWG